MNLRSFRPRGRWRSRVALAFATTAALLAACGRAAPVRPSPEPPRLAVVITLDQCRADYLERFRPYFGGGGFRRLLEDGAVYEECHYRHASTNTANGHATLLTGVHAEVHGIVANEWLLPETLEKVGAVSDPDAPLVGAAPATVRTVTTVVDGRFGASPHRLLASTVGDQLKLRFGGRSRVISISQKNRAAILTGGRRADAAYWIERGRFVTSRFYREALPDWAQAFNAENRIDGRFGAEWMRLREPALYDTVQGPDAAAGEESRHGLGTVFPRRVDGGQPAFGEAFYDAYRLTPFSTEDVTAFALAAIDGEALGRRDAPDLLCLNLSQLDYCGHSFGPDSHEIMDSVLRMDAVLADFLAALDRRIGAGNYLVVVAADHGVAPLPERVQAPGRGLFAGRFDAAAFDRAAQSALDSHFGALADGEYWVIRDSNGYRFRRETLASRRIDSAAAARVLQAALAHLPQVSAAFTRAELLAEPAAGDMMIAAVRRSYHAERSQDVVFVLKPYVVDRSPAGTNHSTPYNYDTHVPLVWYGAGVIPGRHVRRVGTDQLAPTLCGLLGIPPPPQAKAERLF